MQLVVAIIVVVLIAIVLTKAGVGDGVISGIVGLVFAGIAGTGTAAIASMVATPIIGIPVGIWVFLRVLRKISGR